MPETAPATEPSQQVLVMLRLPPSHLRPGADYGGAYGDATDRAARRRVVSALARGEGLKLLDDWPMPLVGVDCFVLSVPVGRSPEAVAAALSRQPAVAWSQPMNLYRAEGAAAGATHNDPLYGAQPAAREWRLAELHHAATGAGVRVAVIDSRVDRAHPDLIGQVPISENFVADRAAAPEQHGTNVAGIIAALADNGIGIAGVAPGARLMALRACWPTAATGRPAATVCDSLSLAKALSFAIDHDAQVINLSLAGRPDRLLGALLDVARDRHATVVAAYDRALPGGGFPASHSGVVAVTDEGAGQPPPGVYGAPGHDIPTTEPGGHWGLVSGASFAAAHVTGLMALMRQRRRLGALTLVALRAGDIDACASLGQVIEAAPRPCAGARGYASVARR
ncbi:MAG TPA: S8 family serine peptidase [Caulobacteraceae bacterium]